MLIRFANAPIERSWRQWQITLFARAHEAFAITHQQTNAALRLKMKEQFLASKKVLFATMNSSLMARVFIGWRVIIRTEKSRRAQFLRSRIQTLATRGARWCWAKWIRHIEVARVENLSRSFGDLRSNLRQQLQSAQRKQVELLVRNHRLQCMTPCFLAWRKYANARNSEKHRLVKRILARGTPSLLWKTWRRWQAEVQQKRALETSIKYEDQFAAFRHSLELQSQTAEQALAAKNAQLQKEKRKQAQRMILHWRQEGLALAFSGWKGVVDRKKQGAIELQERKKALVVKCLFKASLRGQHVAWRKWHEALVEDNIKDFRSTMESMVGRVESQKRARVQRTIARLRHSGMTRAFLQWRDVAVAQIEHRRTFLTQVLKRLAHRSLWRPWRRWTQYIEHLQV